MSQSDFIIDNQSRSLVRAEMNTALQALASCSSGPVAPTPTYPFQFWADTSLGVLKQRNEANTDWVLFQSNAADIQNQKYNSFTSTGTSPDTFFGATTPALTALVANKTRINMTFNMTPASTPSLAVNATPAYGMRYVDALGNKQIITPAQAIAGWNSDFIWDGTYWVMQELLPVSINKILGVNSSVAANALTLGYSGVSLDFRSATLADGNPVYNAVSANSITIPAGATLGTVSGVKARLVLLVAHNNNSSVACVVNLAGGLQLDESNLISPTTIGASSNSANVIYSASPVGANSQYRVLGYFDIIETTAGTWAADATLKQGVGGQALAALSSLGYGQTWQSVTRTAGVTYYNTTGKPIIYKTGIIVSTGAIFSVSVVINGGASITIASCALPSGIAQGAGEILIPPGASYVFTETGVSSKVPVELR